MDKYLSALETLVMLILTIVFISIIYFTLYPLPMEVSKDDTVCIIKCCNCSNLIISKAETNSACYSIVDCEYWRRYPNKGKIISPDNVDYEIFKIKFEFYKLGGEDFDKFISWYEENKDKEYFKYVKKYVVLVDEPIYETRRRSYTRSTGKFVYHGYMPYHVIVGYKQVPKDKYDVKYIDPQNKEYIKQPCSVFEYYVNIH